MLHVHNLRVRFRDERGSFAALDGVSFDLGRGEALALIGESGSGKTTAALSLLGLLPADAELSGTVQLQGRDLSTASEDDLAAIRGSGIAMVFADPLAALNPLLRIGTQIAECVRTHADVDRRSARDAAAAVLCAVGLASAVAELFPHQLSGGMRQRALIAMAIACNPQVLVADEPTSALDAVTQLALESLLLELRRRRQLALVVATHDLTFAARLCDRIAVLYAGRIVEHGPAREILAAPRHPYTAGLLRSLPRPLGTTGSAFLDALPGSAPHPSALPGGCRFRDRCSRARLDCAAAEPQLQKLGGCEVACFHPLERS